MMLNGLLLMNQTNCLKKAKKINHFESSLVLSMLLAPIRKSGVQCLVPHLLMMFSSGVL